jgi:hypothetical protein
MVFMGADGVEGNTSLADEAAADIAELKSIKPTTPELQIFVELHGAGAPPSRQYTSHGNEWKPGPPPGSRPEDFVNGIALTRFLEWALHEAMHKEPDYSLLVLWGHAYRFAIGHTQTQLGVDALDFAELAAVLDRFQEKKRKEWEAAGVSVDRPTLDVVAFDACSLATIEMSYQLAPYAKYLIASEIGIPLPGWPYGRILERLVHPKGELMGPAEFGSWAVRRYCEHYRSLERTVTLSHLNLRHAAHVRNLTESLTRALAVALDEDAAELSQTVRLFELAQTGDGEPFVDVIALCRLLIGYSGSPEVRQAARALGDALASPMSVQPGASHTGECKPFIIEHGANSWEAAGLSGVALYAPHVATAHDLGEASHFYEKFVFARDTLWRDLVRALALPSPVW